jgi:hypothetical protein
VSDPTHSVGEERFLLPGRTTRGRIVVVTNDGARWWVVGLMWDTERPDKPMPPEFLPRRPSSP